MLERISVARLSNTAPWRLAFLQGDGVAGGREQLMVALSQTWALANRRCGARRSASPLGEWIPRAAWSGRSSLSR